VPEEHFKDRSSFLKKPRFWGKVGEGEIKGGFERL